MAESLYAIILTFRSSPTRTAISVLERLPRISRIRLRGRARPRRFRFELLEDRSMPALIIDVGHHFVKPNTDGQTVEISVSSTEASDPLVGGFSLRAQVGGNGPVFDGVAFGSLWNTFPHKASSSWDGHTASGQVTFNDDLDAKANGSLVVLSLDTSGIHSGSFALNLMATAVGNSTLLESDGSNAPSVIINGVVQVLSSWQNPTNPTDASEDGLTTPIDVLLLLNALNAHGPGNLSPPSPGEPEPGTIEWSLNGPKIDVNGDGKISALDALQIVNCLNRNQCQSQPSAIAAGVQPVDKPSDSTGVVDPPTLPGEQTQEPEEEILEPVEPPVDDPPPEEPLVLPEDNEVLEQDPPLEEFVDKLFTGGQLDNLLV